MPRVLAVEVKSFDSLGVRRETIGVGRGVLPFYKDTRLGSAGRPMLPLFDATIAIRN